MLRNHLRADLVDLRPFNLEHEGFYASLRRANVTMSVARQKICSRRASTMEAELLGEETGAPLLTMERTAYNNAGRTIEYGCHVYRPELYAFEMTLVAR